MSQAALAEALGTTQSAVSRLESTDYTAWSVDTLGKIARAFDVRLRITFEGFGSLWLDVGGITKEALERPKIEEDLEFSPFDAEVKGSSSVDLPENYWIELPKDLLQKSPYSTSEGNYCSKFGSDCEREFYLQRLCRPFIWGFGGISKLGIARCARNTSKCQITIFVFRWKRRLRKKLIVTSASLISCSLELSINMPALCAWYIILQKLE